MNRPGYLAVSLFLVACVGRDTSHLDPDQESRLAAQGIVLRADNLNFTRSRDVGRREARRDEVIASIVVTRQTILIHERGYVDFLVEPNTRRFVEVHRDGGRIRINAGTGGNAEVWSFAPPGDAEAWAAAVRAVIRNSHSVANP